MTEQFKDSCYKPIGNGIYRVTGTVRRSARTGRYVFDKNNQTSFRTEAEPQEKSPGSSL